MERAWEEITGWVKEARKQGPPLQGLCTQNIQNKMPGSIHGVGVLPDLREFLLEAVFRFFSVLSKELTAKEKKEALSLAK